ncbi:hypothetical protein TKK_0014800 [Trichogramma kaykai]
MLFLFSHATPENPVLLLLGGHSTHIENLKILDLVKDNDVEILCFFPHCTDKMQPLDVGFNGSLNIAIGKEIADFQRQRNRFTLKYLYYTFGRAFGRAAKVSTEINSFKKCGTFRYNANVFDGEFPDDKTRDSNQPQDKDRRSRSWSRDASVSSTSPPKEKRPRQTSKSQEPIEPEELSKDNQTHDNAAQQGRNDMTTVGEGSEKPKGPSSNGPPRRTGTLRVSGLSP